MEKIFNGKNFLITGGTGSFGNAMLAKLLEFPLKEIRIFSRDEKKQDDMRKKYNDNRIKFYIGDVRDYLAVNQVMKKINFVFHAAALKQVPSCEFFPLEAVKTNILGTSNVLESAIDNSVEKVVCLSTDKAVEPVNSMGLTKALMEKIMISTSRNLPNDQVFCATRYGNVMGSRGSVIPLFIEQLEKKKPITVTDEHMTRFMMTLEDSVDLVLEAFLKGRNGDIFVQKSPAASIKILKDSLLELLNQQNYSTLNIGIRHGEKMHETLLSQFELEKSIDLGKYYQIPADSRDLNYSKYIDNFNTESFRFSNNQGYSSNNTDQLDLESMKKLLLKLDCVKKLVKNRSFL